MRPDRLRVTRYRKTSLRVSYLSKKSHYTSEIGAVCFRLSVSVSVFLSQSLLFDILKALRGILMGRTNLQDDEAATLHGTLTSDGKRAGEAGDSPEEQGDLCVAARRLI